MRVHSHACPTPLPCVSVHTTYAHPHAHTHACAQQRSLDDFLERVPEGNWLTGTAKHFLPVLCSVSADALAQIHFAQVIVLAELIVVEHGDVQRGVADLIARDRETERLVEDRIERLVAY